MSFFRRSKRKLQGLGLIVVVAALVAFAIGIYNKSLPWQHRDTVTLEADRIGHQLVIPADVKLRGILVGSVTQVGSNGKYAVLTLKIDPDQMKNIPSNVEARILPKTLFGEKYVDLVFPPNPSSQHLMAGAVIQQDRSKTSIEAEKVFNDVVPLLQTLKPAELNMTLSALAQTLRGKGDELGQNLVLTDRYLQQFNPNLPTFKADISGLADLATNYDSAAPDLLRMARNFSFNARTVVDKQNAITEVLAGTRTFANTTADFLQRNAQSLIQLPRVSRPTLAVLARYSPEFPCLLQGLVTIEPQLSAAFNPTSGSSPALHVHLQVLRDQPNGYSLPGDKTTYDLDTGPNCRGLPGRPINNSGPLPNSGSSAGSVSSSGTVGIVGSSSGSLADVLSAPILGVHSSDVPDVTNLLVSPMLQGMAVTLS